MQGRFDPALDVPDHPSVQWCARRLLARIHAYTRNRLRGEIEPVSAQDLMRFLLRWQHVAPGTQLQGRAGVLAVVDQLQGFEVAAGAWEQGVLSSRIEQYQGAWLEDACLSGALVWGRLGLRPPSDGPSAPSRLGHPLAVHPDLLRGAGRPALAVAGRPGRRPAARARARCRARPPRRPPTVRGALPLRARGPHRPAAGGGGGRALGPGVPGTGHRRRLRGGALPAVRTRGLAATAPQRDPAVGGPAAGGGRPGRHRGAVGAPARSGPRR